MQDAVRTPAGPIETVMVVDDEVLVRITIADYLRSCGFRVLEAADAAEAVVVACWTAASMSMSVLSAIQMRGPMDGFALKRWVRDCRPNLPVILGGTTAREMDAAADLCKSGPEIARPYQPQLVLDRIRRLLAERDRKRLPSAPRNMGSIAPPVKPTELPGAGA